MKVGQNRPSVPTQSTSTTEARKGTTAAPAQAPTARGANTFQTGFDTTVRKNTFSVEAAATPRVLTPPVPADVPTEGAKLGDDQLRKLLDEAHQLIFGNKANGANVEGWMNQARALRDDKTKNLDANGIKYALFDMLRGAPSAEQMAKPDAKLLGQLVEQAFQLINGPGKKPDATQASELLKFAQDLAGKGQDANTIKYALFDKIRGTASADEMAKPNDTLLRKMLDEAHQLVFGNKANGANVDAWMTKARTMRDQGMDANAIKYALFDELRGAPSASQMAKPDDKLLRTLLDEAHKLVFGNEANGPNVTAWMDKARALRDDTTKNLDGNGIKYALFDLMRRAQ